VAKVDPRSNGGLPHLVQLQDLGNSTAGQAEGTGKILFGPFGNVAGIDRTVWQCVQSLELSLKLLRIFFS
jgi:hypothetical protein